VNKQLLCLFPLAGESLGTNLVIQLFGKVLIVALRVSRDWVNNLWFFNYSKSWSLLWHDRKSWSLLWHDSKSWSLLCRDGKSWSLLCRDGKSWSLIWHDGKLRFQYIVRFIRNVLMIAFQHHFHEIFQERQTSSAEIQLVRVFRFIQLVHATLDLLLDAVQVLLRISHILRIQQGLHVVPNLRSEELHSRSRAGGRSHQNSGLRVVPILQERHQLRVIGRVVRCVVDAGVHDHCGSILVCLKQQLRLVTLTEHVRHDIEILVRRLAVCHFSCVFVLVQLVLSQSDLVLQFVDAVEGFQHFARIQQRCDDIQRVRRKNLERSTEGGRILHHLRAVIPFSGLERPHHLVVLAGPLVSGFCADVLV